jgi:uncharacterized protein
MGRRGYWRVVLGSIFGLTLALGLARAESPTPTPMASPATANPTPEGRVSLEAVARKRLPNTLADVVLGIQVEGRTADAVSNGLAQRSQTLLEYLRQQGVERLRTENVNFQPQVESVRNGPDRIVGYTGSANVSFRTTPDKLGTVLGGSLEHGANTISQTSFSPLESEIDNARRELAIEATKAALARADAVAEAAGVRVVRVEAINVAAEETVVPMGFAKAEAPMPARVATIETATGEQEVAVRVSVQVGTRFANSQ